MDSSLPFFMFWMKRMMEAFVGMDYERGFNLLKDYVEHGEIKSKLNFKGETNYAGSQYIGINRTCKKEELGAQMSADFGKLSEYMHDKKDNISGNTFSIYAKWDMVKNLITYTLGIPVKEVPSDLPEGMMSGSIPSTQVYELHHTGSYAHIANAWSTLNNMARGKAFKWNKKIWPWEEYLNDPASTSADELETTVYFPIKS